MAQSLLGGSRSLGVEKERPALDWKQSKTKADGTRVELFNSDRSYRDRDSLALLELQRHNRDSGLLWVSSSVGGLLEVVC